MDPIEVVKKHWVAKISVFYPLFCLWMLGKSRSYSTGTQPLSFWGKKVNFCIFMIYFTRRNFFGNLLNWNKENLIMNHNYAYRMCGIDPYSMLLNYPLTNLEGWAQWPKIADWLTSLVQGFFCKYPLINYLDEDFIKDDSKMPFEFHSRKSPIPSAPPLEVPLTYETVPSESTKGIYQDDRRSSSQIYDFEQKLLTI